MATARLSRAERSERIRADLLRAARELFVERGYHGASLDQIAEAAGYSKGVVYSRFASKADLFLALLEGQIAARAEEGRTLAAGLHGDAGLMTLLRRFHERGLREPAWRILVLEFRVHAARDTDLNARYAALHEQTLDGVREVVGAIYAGEDPPMPPRRLAEALVAFGTGIELEQLTDPGALGGRRATDLLGPVLTRRPA